MDLVRDVLDRQIVDHRGKAVGRVDGVILELREGQPPRVASLEVGAATLARRIGPWLSRVTVAAMTRWGPRHAIATRIPVELVRTWGKKLVLNVKAEETGALTWEEWWRDEVIGRIPGGRGK